MAIQPPDPEKVKLELESSIVVLVMEPLAKTANRRTIKECGSHMSGEMVEEGSKEIAAPSQLFSHQRLGSRTLNCWQALKMILRDRRLSVGVIARNHHFLVIFC
jgi:hypothetical protein